MQQIERFRQQMPDFEVHHMTENMDQTIAELEASFLNSIPLEARLRGLSIEERLRGLANEERMRGVPVEERLRGLPAEERLRGLPAQEVIDCLLQQDALSVLGEAERALLRKLVDKHTRTP